MLISMVAEICVIVRSRWNKQRLSSLASDPLGSADTLFRGFAFEVRYEWQNTWFDLQQDLLCLV